MFVVAMGSGGDRVEQEEEDMDCGTTTKIWCVRVKIQIKMTW